MKEPEEYNDNKITSLSIVNGVELYSLSAEILTEEDSNFECVRKINEQIHKSDIYNIAVTGAYGAGKTTILKTLTEKCPNQYLKISLANFKVSEDESSNAKKPDEKEEELNRLLEYSIIQQLIYHEDQQTLPESRFRRIKNISPKVVSQVACYIILFFTCLFIIFEPSFVRNTSIYKFLQVSFYWKLAVDVLFCGILLWLSYEFISCLIKAWGNSKLNKINLKDGEIGFCNDDTNSILNKHLDEVLYYFEKTDYNVVIIEDLDRFRTPLIFSKLREINTLINYYKPIYENPNRKIVFIYAVRDDLFVDNTLRTKFFDVIIPVIPIVDPTNAGAKLKQLIVDKVPSEAAQIDAATYKDLGRFVAEMRLLKTIVNDYLVYRRVLSSRPNPANLLAMMAYKNFYPQDFNDLPNKKGLLYQVIHDKEKFTEILKAKIDAKIKEIQKKIENIENQKYKSIKELKSLYLYRFIYYHRGFRAFMDKNSRDINFDEMYEDSTFLKFVDGTLHKYRDTNNYLRDRTMPFSQIEKEVDPNNNYFEKVELWGKRESNEVQNLKREIQKLEGEKLELPYKPISELFVDEIRAEINDYVHSINVDKLDTRLLLYTLQSGLIDSNYYVYISFFHEGLLSSSDNEFLMNITSRRETEFSHPLHNHKTLIEEIPLPLFRQPYILNFSLLSYLCENARKYLKQLEYIFEQLETETNRNVAFFKEFTTTNNTAGLFLKLFGRNWNDLWLYVGKHFSTELNTYSYLILKHFSIDEIRNINKNHQLKVFFEKNFDLFGIWETQLGTEPLMEIIKELSVKFDKIDSSNVSKELFQFIEQGNYYKITEGNILAICLSHGRSDLQEQLDKAHYSTVIKLNISTLTAYIDANIEHYTNAVLNSKATSYEENEATLIKFINDKSLSDEPKKKYLLNQREWISEIENISEAYWDLAILTLIVSPQWNNVLKYYEQFTTNHPKEPLNDGLRRYFSEVAVYTQLSETKVYLDSTNKAVITSLFNEISFDKELDDACYIKLLNAFSEEILVEDSLAGFSSRKVRYLIDFALLPFSDYFLEQLKEHFPDLVPVYLIKYKSEYLGVADNTTLIANQYVGLLSSSAFSDEEHIHIVENINLTELAEDSQLATLMSGIIATRTNFNVDDDVITKIIQLCENEVLKTHVVYRYFTNIDYDEDVISRFLNLLSEDYKKITIKGSRPRISKESNRDLLDLLKRKGYLKNVIPHEEYIKVVCRD